MLKSATCFLLLDNSGFEQVMFDVSCIKPYNGVHLIFLIQETHREIGSNFGFIFWDNPKVGGTNS